MDRHRVVLLCPSLRRSVLGDEEHRYRNHELRRAEMRKYTETKSILAEYHRVHLAAQEARYDGTPFNQNNLDDLEPAFQGVRSAMRRVLGLSI